MTEEYLSAQGICVVIDVSGKVMTRKAPSSATQLTYHRFAVSDHNDPQAAASCYATFRDSIGPLMHRLHSTGLQCLYIFAGVLNYV